MHLFKSNNTSLSFIMTFYFNIFKHEIEKSTVLNFYVCIYIYTHIYSQSPSDCIEYLHFELAWLSGKSISSFKVLQR